MVSIKEGSINLYTFDSATRYPKPDDDPIVRLGVVTPCLPSIIPCACRNENTRTSYRWFRVREIRGRGKPFVGEGEDGGFEGGGYEIWAEEEALEEDQ